MTTNWMTPPKATMPLTCCRCRQLVSKCLETDFLLTVTKRLEHEQPINLLMNRNSSSFHGLHKLLMNLTSYPLPAPELLTPRVPQTCNAWIMVLYFEETRLLFLKTQAWAKSIVLGSNCMMKGKSPRDNHVGKISYHFPAQKTSSRRKRSHKYMHLGAENISRI